MAVKGPLLLLLVVLLAIVNGQRNIAINLMRAREEIRELELGQNPELRQFAAMTGETVQITIDGPEILAVVAEGVNANYWCLPWLERFPGGRIRWSFLPLGSDFMTPGVPQPLNPGTEGRITIGGPFNEWLNITGTLVVAQAEVAHTGRYTCEVCFTIGENIEDCHSANVSLQVIGAPPTIIDMPDDAGPTSGGFDDISVQYTIGTDFCIPRDFRGTIRVDCAIEAVPIPHPSPDRGYIFNDEPIYSLPQNVDPPFSLIMDFLEASPNRIVLGSMVFEPQVLGGIIGGALSFDLTFNNITQMVRSGLIFPGRSPEELEDLVFEEISGDWTCTANNTFGMDTATTTIRRCLSAPNVPTCAPNEVIFGNPGELVPVGCTVCIRPGDVVTLDCSSTSMGVNYVWVDGMGNFVSSSPMIPVFEAGNYSCSASNIDNPTEISVTVLAFSDGINFMGTLMGAGVSTPRQDNGCSRITGVDLTGVNICAFVGETLVLTCRTADGAMEELEITSNEGVMATGSLTLTVSPATEGLHSCRLSNNPGPCAVATETINVRVFDPAVIDRVGFIPEPCIGPGRFPDTFQPGAGTRVLCCPATGIDDPQVDWFQVTIDQFGCANEMNLDPIDGFNVIDRANYTEVTVTIGPNDAVTYLCRARNSAGADAAIISFRGTEEVGEYQLGPFSACSMMCQDGIRTRSVTCVSSRDGRRLPSSRCPGTPPPSSEVCTEFNGIFCDTQPVWVPGEWGPCTKDCGGGFRFRPVRCIVPLTSEEMPENYCNLQPRPLFYDIFGCRRPCCLRDNYPASCRKEGARRCNEITYARNCCWTCGLKSIP